MSSPAAAPVTLDQTSNVGGLRLIQRGTYDPASGAVSGVEPYAAIWIAGGKIWRASATAGGTPSSAQVSSEANVGDPSPLNPTPFHLCDTAVVNDWANPGDSRFFYTLAGSDKQCGGSDDVEKSTRLTAPASEAPVTVPGKRVAAIQTPATGALSGWLVLGTSFVRTDPSFANPVVVLAGVGAAALVAGTPSQMLLRVHSSGTVRVQRFDPAAGTLDSTDLFTLPGGISATTGATAQDASNAYMIAYDAGFAASLYRLPLSATQADSAVQMTSEAGRTVTSLLFHEQQGRVHGEHLGNTLAGRGGQGGCRHGGSTCARGSAALGNVADADRRAGRQALLQQRGGQWGPDGAGLRRVRNERDRPGRRRVARLHRRREHEHGGSRHRAVCDREVRRRDGLHPGGRYRRFRHHARLFAGRDRLSRTRSLVGPQRTAARFHARFWGRDLTAKSCSRAPARRARWYA